MPGCTMRTYSFQIQKNYLKQWQIKVHIFYWPDSVETKICKMMYYSTTSIVYVPKPCAICEIIIYIYIQLRDSRWQNYLCVV